MKGSHRPDGRSIVLASKAVGPARIRSEARGQRPRGSPVFPDAEAGDAPGRSDRGATVCSAMAICASSLCAGSARWNPTSTLSIGTAAERSFRGSDVVLLRPVSPRARARAPRPGRAGSPTGGAGRRPKRPQHGVRATEHDAARSQVRPSRPVRRKCRALQVSTAIGPRGWGVPPPGGASI